MLEASRIELHRIVLEAIDKHGEPMVVKAIDGANLRGEVDGHIVTTHNMHLFRQFRNSLGGSRCLIAMVKEKPHWELVQWEEWH